MSSPILKTAVAAAVAVGAVGCHCGHDDCNYAAPPPPLGHLVDPIFQQQEANAEASDFAIHEHEFKGNSAMLNQAGEQHVKQIAVRAGGVPFPIIIQPSSMSFEEEVPTGFEYPVHNDRDLDLERRQVVVAALHTMGVDDAEERVVVSPLLTPGFEAFQAERAYQRGFSNTNGFYGGRGYGTGGFGGLGGGGFGGFGGGVGGFGGIGGFGGGFF